MSYPPISYSNTSVYDHYLSYYIKYQRPTSPAFEEGGNSELPIRHYSNIGDALGISSDNPARSNMNDLENVLSKRKRDLTTSSEEPQTKYQHLKA